ncbi:MAG: family 43 glycosylhydrolase [Candidatus Krumholzibacteria bacterium]|nr:family 43 glycosylhydrolase [Candidatus Krumholzibacteria bacterium]
MSPRAMHAGFVLFVAAAIACAPATLRAAVAFDFEGPVFYEPGEIVKDHALILVNDTFRLYYITTSQRSFGYATSSDLRHWTRRRDALRAGPDEWDSLAIWAPSIASYPYGPGYYLMFYTGVNAAVAQRTCLAMSHVPDRWSKASSILFTPFHGDTTWMAWREDSWSNYRDPGFFRENGTSYLVHCAHTRELKGAIALAQSDDWFTWRDAGPIYVHGDWHALESPFLMKRNGVYHLFFTEETVGGVSHMASDSLRSGWNIVKRTIIDGGHAAELLDLGGDAYVISRHTSYSSAGGSVSTIRFDTLDWLGDEPAVEIPPPLEGWTILWGHAFDRQPVFGNNPRFRGDDTTETLFEGNGWIGTYESFSGPLTGSSPGAFQGDGARGAIRSKDFTITGLSMRLLVGGGAYPDSCYVALCDARSGEILFRETGRNTDRMDERIWNLYPLRGWTVYLTIVDDCGAPFGHINVDGIEERLIPVGPPPDGDRLHPKSKKKRIVAVESLSPAAPSDRAPGPPAFTCSPNPFNPSTEIFIRSAPNAILAVSIYDVAGRSLGDLETRTDARGEAAIRWPDGDRGGASLPSGVYFAVLRDGPRIIARLKLVLAR